MRLEYRRPPSTSAPVCSNLTGLLVDACGVCVGDNSTCAGCDGVAHSGRVLDVCAVCGGDALSCPSCSALAGSGLFSALVLWLAVSGLVALVQAAWHVRVEARQSSVYFAPFIHLTEQERGETQLQDGERWPAAGGTSGLTQELLVPTGRRPDAARPAGSEWEVKRVAAHGGKARAVDSTWMLDAVRMRSSGRCACACVRSCSRSGGLQLLRALVRLPSAHISLSTGSWVLDHFCDSCAQIEWCPAFVWRGHAKSDATRSGASCILVVLFCGRWAPGVRYCRRSACSPPPRCCCTCRWRALG